jgi:fibronectin-binding autotransporter adhesin
VLDKNIFKPNSEAPLLISFRAPRQGQVRVSVYNLAGELVEPIWRGNVAAGIWYQQTWNGHNRVGEMVASGIYFVSVRGAGIRSVRKVILLK